MPDVDVWGRRVVSGQPQENRLPGLIDQLALRANANDKTYRIIEASLLLLSGICLTVAGMIFQPRLGLALLALAVGVLLGVLNVLLSSRRKERETGPLAEAVTATAEAMTIRAHAELAMRNAQDSLTAMTDERDSERVAKLAAEKSVVDLKQQIEIERTLGQDWHARWNAMLVALTSMNKAAEVAPPSMKVIDLLESMLDYSQYDLEKAFDFDKLEKWTFSIFSREIVDNVPLMVRRIARARDPNETKDRRRWASGEGFTGYAWHHGVDLVISDRGAPEFAGKFHVPEANRKTTDAKAYVSVAAIPIRIGQDRTDIVGVITVTSDTKDRFLSNPTDPRALNTELIRQIEAIVSVQIAMRRTENDGIFKSP